MAQAVAPALLLGVLLPLARADLHFPAPGAEAGEVRSGAPLSHRFEFVNPGPGTVEVIQLRSSCGCLKPRLEKRTYGPGENGSVVLEVHTLSQPAGEQTWHLRVGYRVNGADREADLKLRARVIREVKVEPAQLTLFTSGGAGHEIVVTDLRPRPLTVTGVSASAPHLTTRVVGESRDESGRRCYRIALAVTAECPEGRHEEMASLFTDDPHYRELRVPVTIVKRPKQRVSAAPAAITLLAPRGQPVPSRVLRICPASEEPVVIESIEADDPALVATWAQGPNHLATVKVGVDRKRVTGDRLRSAIHVRVSSPIRETITIPVTCRIE
jgi:hypothetical protein